MVSTHWGKPIIIMRAPPRLSQNISNDAFETVRMAVCDWREVPLSPFHSVSSSAAFSLCPSHDDDDVELNVLGCRVDIIIRGQTGINACAWFNVALRPQKP